MNKKKSFISWISKSESRKCFTLCQIKRHRTLASCWLVCQNNVYDATDFFCFHPGGITSILRHSGGEDCSLDFNFHSRNAQKLWKSKQIGYLIKCPGEQLKNSNCHRVTSGDCLVI